MDNAQGHYPMRGNCPGFLGLTEKADGAGGSIVPVWRLPRVGADLQSLRSGPDLLCGGLCASGPPGIPTPEALEFRSNNQQHRPVIQALALLKRYAGQPARTFPATEEVPLYGIVAGLWREAVLEKDGKGRSRINRITYEICVLEALRDGIRCKEIWVVGAHRYRNPDQDLPADFEAQRERYYQALNLPLDTDTFIATLQIPRPPIRGQSPTNLIYARFKFVECPFPG